MVILLGMLALAVLSLRWRIQDNLHRQVQPIASPLAEAMGQLVGVAGGIYVSLVMLVSFLQLEVPEQMVCLGRAMDPMAVAAIVLACVQPLGFSLLRRLTERR